MFHKIRTQRFRISPRARLRRAALNPGYRSADKTLITARSHLGAQLRLLIWTSLLDTAKP
jgi:hypothetical protein